MKRTNLWRMWVALPAIVGWLTASLQAQDLAVPPFSFDAFLSSTGTQMGGETDTQIYSQIVVVADETSNTLIVTAPEEVLKAIDDLIRQLDQPVQEQAVLRTFFLQNADPTEMAATLAAMFPDPTESASGWNSASTAGFGAAPVFQSKTGASTSAAQHRATEASRGGKLTKLIAVADTRTGAVIVNAPARMIPAVEGLIHEIDSNSTQQSSVAVISLKHAAVFDVEAILQGLVGGTSTQTDQNNPLQNRNQFLSGGGGSVSLGGTGTAGN